VGIDEAIEAARAEETRCGRQLHNVNVL